MTLRYAFVLRIFLLVSLGQKLVFLLKRSPCLVRAHVEHVVELLLLAFDIASLDFTDTGTAHFITLMLFVCRQYAVQLRCGH
jgi:hypothetical protein